MTDVQKEPDPELLAWALEYCRPLPFGPLVIEGVVYVSANYYVGRAPNGVIGIGRKPVEEEYLKSDEAK